MKYCFMCVLIILSSCSFEYELDNVNDFKPKIIVNSLISPENAIDFNLGWSKHYAMTEYPDTVIKGNYTIIEDGIVVCDGIIENKGYVGTSYIPKSGSTYQLSLNIDGYGLVSATTYIPHAGNATGNYDGINFLLDDNLSSIYHFSINKVSYAESLKSVWFRIQGGYSSNTNDNYIYPIGFYEYIYSDNKYIDDFNSENAINGFDDQYIEKYRYATCYQSLFRLPFYQINNSLPIHMSYRMPNSIRSNFPPFDDILLKQVRIKVMYPSDEYDNYKKNFTQQINSIYNPEFPFFSDEVHIFSNINNGLGIFAGYNVCNVDLLID